MTEEKKRKEKKRNTSWLNISEKLAQVRLTKHGKDLYHESMAKISIMKAWQRIFDSFINDHGYKYIGIYHWVMLPKYCTLRQIHSN
jgi:hypothetical protein